MVSEVTRGGLRRKKKVEMCLCACMWGGEGRYKKEVVVTIMMFEYLPRRVVGRILAQGVGGSRWLVRSSSGSDRVAFHGSSLGDLRWEEHWVRVLLVKTAHSLNGGDFVLVLCKATLAQQSATGRMGIARRGAELKGLQQVTQTGAEPLHACRL